MINVNFCLRNIMMILCIVCPATLSSSPLHHPFPSESISSPYGPRYVYPKHKNFKKTFDIHHGLDYAQQVGTPINAIEGGKIKNVKIDKLGNYISIGNDRYHFTYIHVFYDGYTPGSMLTNLSGDDKHRYVSLEIVEPKTAGKQACLGIAFWSVKKSLTSILSNCKSRFGGKDTQTSVKAGEVIGLVGTSGGVAAHLHLQLKEVQNTLELKDKPTTPNPLKYIQTVKRKYTAEFVNVPYGPGDVDIYPFFKLRVDPTIGNDLDTVDIMVGPGRLRPNYEGFDGSFYYGGQNGIYKVNINHWDPTLNKPGIVPRGRGKQDFIVPFNFNALPPGCWTLTAYLDSVNADPSRTAPDFDKSATFDMGGGACTQPAQAALRITASQPTECQTSFQITRCRYNITISATVSGPIGTGAELEWPHISAEQRVTMTCGSWTPSSEFEFVDCVRNEGNPANTAITMNISTFVQRGFWEEVTGSVSLPLAAYVPWVPDPFPYPSSCSTGIGSVNKAKPHCKISGRVVYP